MLKIVIKEGRAACVCAFCDQCKGEITECSRGLYTWMTDDHGTPVTGQIIFLHKGACDRAFQVGNAKSRWPWNELSCLPIYLGNNMGLDWAGTTETLRLFAETGL